MANKPVKKDSSNANITHNTHYNTQFNILMENEFNAISKIADKDMQRRAFDLLEKSLEYRNSSDKEIIDLERINLNIRKENDKKFWFWSGGSIFIAGFISIGALVGGVILGINGYSTESIISLLICGINILPRVVESIRKKH